MSNKTTLKRHCIIIDEQCIEYAKAISKSRSGSENISLGIRLAINIVKDLDEEVKKKVGNG